MSKGGSTTTKESGTQTVQLPQWMSDAGHSLFDKAMADSAANPVTPYTGEMSAPMSGNQTAAANQAAANANAGQSQIQAGGDMVKAGTATGDRVSTSNFDAAAAAKYMSPYLADVQKRTTDEMQRQGKMQLADLGDNAEASMAFGGDRQAIAESEAAKGINNNILDYLARSNEAGYENAQQQFNTDADRQLTASTTNAGLTQSELDRKVAAGAAMGNLGQQASGVNAESILNLLKTGGVAQDTQNAQDAAAYDEFLRNQDGTVNRDEDLMAILAGTPRNVTTNSSGTTKQSQNPGWLSTAMGLGSMAASIYSDPRLKTNVERVGELSDGLPIYEFDYLPNMGLPEGRFRGPMADEVAEFQPWAVGAPIGGWATIIPSALEI